jgi:hypothetical protein
MDPKLHRDKRAEFFQRQERRYEDVFKWLGINSLKELKKYPPASLRDEQIPAILEFLSQEAQVEMPLDPLLSRDDAIEIDKKFHGTESDIAQTLTSEQEKKFTEEFPKARSVLARLVLPKLLERFDTHLNERPPFNIDEYDASGPFPNGFTEDAASYFGWAQNAESTNGHIKSVLSFVQKEESPSEHKKYQGHLVHIELDKHHGLLFDATNLDSEDEFLREIRHKIDSAEKRFTPAFSGGSGALIDSLFSSIDVAPLDPMPFLSDTEMISARQKDVRALQLGDKPVPYVLAQLICDAKIQYILNRPFAFAAMARAALEELLRYHNNPAVRESDSNGNPQLAARISNMKKDKYRELAMDITGFGNVALHHATEFSGLDPSTRDKKMQDCMKGLDDLAERFLPGSKKHQA